MLEDLARPVTPDMVETKLGKQIHWLPRSCATCSLADQQLYTYSLYVAVKTEFVDVDELLYDESQAQKIAEETPSPHLQDHQYGQNPCPYPDRRRPAQPSPWTEVNTPTLYYFFAKSAVPSAPSSSKSLTSRLEYLPTFVPDTFNFEHSRQNVNKACTCPGNSAPLSLVVPWNSFMKPRARHKQRKYQPH